MHAFQLSSVGLVLIVFAIHTDFKTAFGNPCVTKPTYPIDCQDICADKDGIHRIFPNGSKIGTDVFCDMTTDGGGWTVFQRRMNGVEDFYKEWFDYKFGFGKLHREFWLGNLKINLINRQGWYELRIDLEDFEGAKRYAVYRLFNIGDSHTNFRLTVEGYFGDAGDSFSSHNDAQFSTKDRDNDVSHSNCAKLYSGAWWYSRCHESNLNGMYQHGRNSSYGDGVNWVVWKGYNYSLKKTEMKMRRAI